MSDHYWLTEAQIERLKPHLPRAHGVPRVDDRQVVTAQDVEWSLRRVIALNKTPSFILSQFGFTPEDVAGASAVDGIAVDSELRGRLMYISMNQKNEILSNPKVVEALKYLIDNEGMQNSFLNG